jgi:nickel transport protein
MHGISRPLRPLIILLALLVAAGLPVGEALSHGVHLDYTATTKTITVIEIVATFDTGEPMRGGQVAVFAPDNPKTPWQTGVCDNEGRYRFTPDASLAGTWEVQVRQSGHGAILYINVGPETTSTAAADAGPGAEPLALQVHASSGHYTPLQYVLMGGCVVWGFVGTALYFSRKFSQNRRNI